MNLSRRTALLCLGSLLLSAPGLLSAEDSQAASAPVYVQHENIVYGETDGVGLVMDIFQPTGTPNGLGIIDICSGGWNASRGQIESHREARLYDIMCGRGYTVFAVRPGSTPRFAIPDMLKHVHTSIRWIKAHADEYQIDPERMGICGASAGGHLASLAVVTATDGDSSSPNPLMRHGTRVKAAIVLFPPTDFLNWKIGPLKVRVEAGGPTANMLGKMLFGNMMHDIKPEDVVARLTEISPARLVKGGEPPFLIFHGDADPLVPLEQSELLRDALSAAGVPVELIVKEGGAHPWPTVYEEIALGADWIDKQLSEVEVSGAGR